MKCKTLHFMHNSVQFSNIPCPETNMKGLRASALETGANFEMGLADFPQLH